MPITNDGQILGGFRSRKPEEIAAYMAQFADHSASDRERTRLREEEDERQLRILLQDEPREDDD